MKWILGIMTVLIGGFGFSQSEQTTDLNLEKQFVNADLSEANRLAFESRAKEKVLDFCNYIQLISNKDYDVKFREHAQNSAISLFNSLECRVADSLTGTNQAALLVSDYFKEIYETEYHTISCEATNLVLSENLTEIDADHYVGSISYTRIIKCSNKKGEVKFAAQENRTVGVTLSRKIKRFGDTEKKIWVVNLCDVI